jgi:hypothetical protein
MMHTYQASVRAKVNGRSQVIKTEIQVHDKTVDTYLLAGTDKRKSRWDGRTHTSIDSLSPDSPIFPALLRARQAPWVRYHNIIGMIEKTRWFTDEPIDSDGIVSLQSAHMNRVGDGAVMGKLDDGL